MSILDVLIPALQERFPNRGMRIKQPGEADIVFPAAHPEFGDLIIYDEGEEITIMVGNFTHFHVGHETKSDAAVEITKHAIKYLDDLFADRIVLWNGLLGFGLGHRPRDDRDKAGSTFFRRKFVWSGPLPRYK
ncbi:MAG: hypothetical protein HY081_10985 [Gammaproteobacteria bacterium]|nr:hypothetical protein [Gammaproteobacteria bacterium]